MAQTPGIQSKRARQRLPWEIRYSGALASCAIAVWIWFLWPVTRHDPLVIFIAAVIVVARFLGFGPALLCTALSSFALDYLVFEPRFSFALSVHDYGRMFVFIVASVLTAGLARQRSRAEIKAEQIGRQIAAIVESSGEAILSKDMNGIITSWNRGAERLYGYSADEAIGKHVSMLAPPEQQSEIAAIMRRLPQGDSIQNHQTRRLRKAGTCVTVYLSISPIRNQRGEIIGASSIAHDVTAQKQAEEALRRNEKLATAGRLAAAVAHEINNPLEAVTNLLYLAEHDPQSRNEYLRLAEQEVQRVGEVAQQMLGFVRENAAPVLLNVSKILDQVLQLYMRKLSAKHIQITKDYDRAVQVRGFAGELRQVFSNLILNAADALPDGGRLMVRVAQAHQWRDGNPGARVTVADNGLGIRPADLAHMFEPFHTTKKDVGTGLGLWLSHGIVQKHGGSLRVRSRTLPGRSGTVFSVFLPYTAESRRQPAELKAGD